MNLGSVISGIVATNVALLVLVVGWVVVGGPLVVHAQGPATIPNDVAAQYGFDEPTVDHVEIDRTVTYNGVSKRIDASFYVTTAGASDGSILMTISLPAWRVANLVNTNPVAYLPLEQLLEYLLPHLPVETPEIEKVGETRISIAGDETAVSEYEMRPEDGARRKLLLSRTTIEGDLVFVVALGPEGTEREERLVAVISRIQHGGD